jgi:hypothetical protein
MLSILTPHFLNVHFSIIILSTHRSLSICLQSNILHAFVIPSMLHALSVFGFITLLVFVEVYETLRIFPPSSVISS